MPTDGDAGDREAEHDSQPPLPEGRILVLGTSDPVAASRLESLLQAQGIEAAVLTRTDVYFGAGGSFYPDTYQVVVGEHDAERRTADIDAALAEVRAEWAEPVPDAETEAEPATE